MCNFLLFLPLIQLHSSFKTPSALAKQCFCSYSFPVAVSSLSKPWNPHRVFLLNLLLPLYCRCCPCTSKAWQPERKGENWFNFEILVCKIFYIAAFQERKYNSGEAGCFRSNFAFPPSAALECWSKRMLQEGGQHWVPWCCLEFYYQHQAEHKLRVYTEFCTALMDLQMKASGQEYCKQWWLRGLAPVI